MTLCGAATCFALVTLLVVGREEFTLSSLKWVAKSGPKVKRPALANDARASVTVIES